MKHDSKVAVHSASRRKIITTAAGVITSSFGLWGLGSDASAQQIGATKRIGIITFRGATPVEEGFQFYLNRTGFKCEFMTEDIGRDLKKIPEVLQRMKLWKADALLTWGTSVTEKVKAALISERSDRPDAALKEWKPALIYALVTDPVAAGVVNQLDRSAEPITGVYHVAALDKQMEAMARYRPAKHVGMVYTPTEANSRIVADRLTQWGRNQRIKISAIPVALDAQGKPDHLSLNGLLNELGQRQIDWLYLPPDSFIGAHANKIVIPVMHDLGVPTFASTEQLMDAGALFGLMCSYFEVGQLAGFKALRVLRDGIFAGAIPSSTLSTFSLRINTQVAKQLKLTPPLPLFGIARFTPQPA